MLNISRAWFDMAGAGDLARYAAQEGRGALRHARVDRVELRRGEHGPDGAAERLAGKLETMHDPDFTYMFENIMARID